MSEVILKDYYSRLLELKQAYPKMSQASQSSQAAAELLGILEMAESDLQYYLLKLQTDIAAEVDGIESELRGAEYSNTSVEEDLDKEIETLNRLVDKAAHIFKRLKVQEHVILQTAIGNTALEGEFA